MATATETYIIDPMLAPATNKLCDLKTDTNGNKTMENCDQNAIFRISEIILQNINDFNEEYINLKTFIYNTYHNQPGDTTPQLSYVGKLKNKQVSITDFHFSTPTQTTIDTNNRSTRSNYNVIIHLTGTELLSYDTVKNNIETFTKILNYFTKTSSSTITTNDLVSLQNTIQLLRNDLDNKINELNTNQNSIAQNNKFEMNTNIFINILWTTIATSLIILVFLYL
jgi:hypothetical protein